MGFRPVTALLMSFAAFAFSQDARTDQPPTIRLTVPAGVPLRLYLSKRVSKRAGAPVEATLLAPVYVFDRKVIPSGVRVFGHVSRLQPVSKWERTRAVLGGDFTPLRVAQIEFTSLVLPDGSQMPLHTVASDGLNSLVPFRSPKPQNQSKQSSTGGVIGAGEQKIKEQVNAQIDRVKGIPDIVRGPNKKEWLTDFLMSKLPYHPQYVRSRTRFDAELQTPLDFGSEIFAQDSLNLVGSQPAAGSVAHARLLTALNSGSSTQGQKVEAVLDEPLFSAGHKLLLPEATRLDGAVVVVRKARWFHRTGRLRFTFQNVDLPPQVAELRLATAPSAAPKPQSQPEKTLQFRSQGTLAAAESGNAPVSVDKEGGVQAKDSKTRFIGTAVALLIARAAGDNDPTRSPTGEITGQSSNVAGRTLGGGMGFGLLGTIAAQSSRNVGAALGYYGLAWTVFSTVVARGADVQFDKNAVIDIGFNTRNATGSSKLNSAGTATKASR